MIAVGGTTEESLPDDEGENHEVGCREWRLPIDLSNPRIDRLLRTLPRVSKFATSPTGSITETEIVRTNETGDSDGDPPLPWWQTVCNIL